MTIHITLKELESEAFSTSDSFGPCWKSLLDEVTFNVIKGNRYHPQNSGFFGYGETGVDWSDEDILRVKSSTFQNQIRINNSHLNIVLKAKNVSHVKGILGDKVKDELSRLRIRTVDENTLDVLKEILKKEFNIVLPTTGASLDPNHLAEIQNLILLFRTFKQRWRPEGALNREGQPYTRLPKLFFESDLRKSANFISGMTFLPTSGEMWDVLREIIDKKEGSQAHLKEKLTRAQDGDSYSAIAPSSHIEASSRRLKTDITDILDIVPGEERQRLAEPTQEFVGLLTDEERNWIVNAYASKNSVLFRGASTELQVEAVGVENPEALIQVMMGIKEKSSSVQTRFSLTEEEVAAMASLSVMFIDPPSHYIVIDEEVGYERL